MHARYFSAHLGRFMSVDRVGGSEDNPQSWNRYSYVLGNPLRYVDPDGQIWTPKYETYERIRTSIRTTLEKVPIAGRVLASTVDFFLADYLPVNNAEAAAAVDSMVASYGAAVLSPAGKAANLATKLDNIFSRNLSRATVEAAAREKLGQVVSRKATGEVFDHVTKFEEALVGAKKAVASLQRLVGDTRLTDAEHTYVQYLLSKYSKKVDEVEELLEKELKRAAQ